MKKFKIGNRTYKVEDENPVIFTGVNISSANCDSTNKIINLQKGLDDEDKDGMLLHELTHAFMNENNQRIFDDEGKEGKYDEEFIARFVARFGREIIAHADSYFKDKGE